MSLPKFNPFTKKKLAATGGNVNISKLKNDANALNTKDVQNKKFFEENKDKKNTVDLDIFKKKELI
jgi:hypothetical protein